VKGSISKEVGPLLFVVNVRSLTRIERLGSRWVPS